MNAVPICPHRSRCCRPWEDQASSLCGSDVSCTRASHFYKQWPPPLPGVGDKDRIVSHKNVFPALRHPLHLSEWASTFVLQTQEQAQGPVCRRCSATFTAWLVGWALKPRAEAAASPWGLQDGAAPIDNPWLPPGPEVRKATLMFPCFAGERWGAVTEPLL